MTDSKIIFSSNEILNALNDVMREADCFKKYTYGEGKIELLYLHSGGGDHNPLTVYKRKELGEAIIEKLNEGDSDE